MPIYLIVLDGVMVAFSTLNVSPLSLGPLRMIASVLCSASVSSCLFSHISCWQNQQVLSVLYQYLVFVCFYIIFQRVGSINEPCGTTALVFIVRPFVNMTVLFVR